MEERRKDDRRKTERRNLMNDRRNLLHDRNTIIKKFVEKASTDNEIKQVMDLLML